MSNALTSATITGLEPSLTYNVQVTAATSAGLGAQSPPSVAEIFVGQPGIFKGQAWGTPKQDPCLFQSSV